MKSFIPFYIKSIKHLQSILSIGSVGIFLLVLPMVLVFKPELLRETVKSTLFFISFASVSFVMAIRPLADIFSGNIWVRSLVVLRKGFGILSASIIVSFMLVKVVTLGSEYFINFSQISTWKISDFGIFARLGDVTAVVLLITSNTLSKNILGANWKRIQKLAYVYFYAGGLYEYLAFHDQFALYAMIIVSILVLTAFFINRSKKM